ncbi:hypothetical protein K1719_039888 [Acacia pycnantha]|nr:hypothetical protein K1719_039888 [Acacia pycnantha]
MSELAKLLLEPVKTTRLSEILSEAQSERSTECCRSTCSIPKVGGKIGLFGGAAAGGPQDARYRLRHSARSSTYGRFINIARWAFSIRREAQHQFNASENDWGFTNFMPLAELFDPGRGYLVNDTCIVEAEVAVKLVTLMQ